MEIVNSFPEGTPVGSIDKGSGLRTHQIRVLRALAAAKGPMSRAALADKVGSNRTVTDRALGLEGKEFRDITEKPIEEGGPRYGGFPSLITLGMVRRYELDIDGLTEVCYELSLKGRKALEETQHIDLPQPRGKQKGS